MPTFDAPPEGMVPVGTMDAPPEGTVPARSLTWGDAVSQAFQNIPSSAVQFGKDIVRPVTHPVETVENLYALGKGIVQLAIPGEQPSEKVARAVGQFFVDRYGSLENIKQTIARDPVGTLADLSAILSGGGALAARAPGTVGRAGRVVGTAGRAIDPITMASRGVRAAGRAGAYGIGALGTHTGGASLREAFKAGVKGGDIGATFRQHMRGRVSPQAVVDEARDALTRMRIDRGHQYRVGMSTVTKDPTVLDFEKIQQAVNKVADVGQYKGVNINPAAAGVWQEINEKIQQWADLVPDEFHTVEGIDALKQAIGNIRDGTQPGTPARKVATDVYRSVRSVITDQAPDYAKIMKGYEEATDLINDIERTLSLGERANVDTAVRKLQSIMRNNVNTTYGRRVELARKLEEAGAKSLVPAVAGQALNTWTPRGFGTMLGPASGVAGYQMFGLSPELAGLLAMQSPRLMGETAHLMGQASRFAPTETGLRGISRGLFQAGRLPR